MYIHTIVLREDDNSEKTNSYIDAAIGKREPVEKVSSIYLVNYIPGNFFDIKDFENLIYICTYL